MNTLKFQTDINAPREQVWNALWDQNNYRQWTEPFNVDAAHQSQLQGELKQGNEIQFMGDRDNGMYAQVETLKPNEEMKFRHMGEIKAGQRLEPANAAKGMGTECYRLTERNGKTHLEVDVDAPNAMTDQIRSAFPQALARVKTIAETQTKNQKH